MRTVDHHVIVHSDHRQRQPRQRPHVIVAWSLNARLGLAVMLVGLLLLAISAIQVVVAFPSAWYGSQGTLAEAQAFIRSILILGGLGIVMTMLGNSLLIYGRGLKLA